MENMEKKAMEMLKEANKDQPEMAGKLHIEAFWDGEKKEEHDHECEGFVVMAFMDGQVAIHVHGCCIAQMAAAIDGHKELSEAAMLVANRRAKENVKELLRGILEDQEETEE
jgi:hypothetical protein